MPGAGGLVGEIKGNTQHYLGVIAEAADAQLASLSVTGAVPADIYDTLLEAVRPVLMCCWNPIVASQWLVHGDWHSGLLLAALLAGWLLLAALPAG